MKKYLFFIIYLFVIKTATAQQIKELYVAYSTGVNMRKTPSLKAELVGKIPYSTKLKIDESKKDTTVINVEGLYGSWIPVSYNGKSGWVLNSYLIPLVPPKKSTKKMSDYLAQISTKACTAVQTTSGTMNVITENGNKQTKQLYKNGAQHNSFAAYEYNSDTYTLPNVTMQEAFLILRQIEEFADLFTEKTDFPLNSKKEQRKNKEYSTEYNYKITKDSYGNYERVQKVEIEFENGAYYHFEMYQLENDIVIFFSVGV